MSSTHIEIATPHEIPRYNAESVFQCPSRYGKEWISEFIGMYLFITLSLGNIAIFVLYPESKMTWDGVSLAWGFNLTLGIYLASFNSQAHLNPCVSLCMFLFEPGFSFARVCLYTSAQLVGAFTAAGTVYGIYYNAIMLAGKNQVTASIFSPYPVSQLTTVSAIFNEFIGTALLVGGIFALIKHTETSKHLPIYVGVLLSAITYSFGFQTGFALNPARFLGPMMFTAMVGFESFSYGNYYFWMALLGQFTGAIFGVLVFIFFIKNQISD